MKNTRKDIESLITTKHIKMSVQRTLLHDGNTITKLHDIANISNDYFASNEDNAKQNIKF